jgi:XTP/dITP diphosphohydrolase
MIPSPDHEKASREFTRLLEIMDELRAKCPWDRKQSFESLRPLTLEEVYELSESLQVNDLKSIPKEIGDVLLHLVFYAKIGSEKQAFSMYEVIHLLCEKLIFRHPHIYGDVVVEGEEEVKRNWEQLKIKEGNPSILGGVPASLPALIKASRIQEKASGVGFDWNNGDLIWDKVKEELEEFYLEMKEVHPEKEESDQKNKMEQEFGDILFSLVNFARFHKINPENALEKTNKKFIRRFSYIEKAAREQGLAMNASNLEAMEKLWNEAKSSGV